MGLSATLGPTASDLSFHLSMWGGAWRLKRGRGHSLGTWLGSYETTWDLYMHICYVGLQRCH